MITGFVGQISVVQLALAGVCGFILSHLATDHGIGFPAGDAHRRVRTRPCAALAHRRFGAARARRSLAVVTLAAAVAIASFVFLQHDLGRRHRSTRAAAAGCGLDLGNVRGVQGLDGQLPSPVFGFLVLGVTVALCLLVANMRRVDLGQRMLAVRSNERAAAAAGINVRSVKLAAFAIGSFIAGIAGAMYGYNFSSVSVDALLRDDGAEPDRLRLHRRHHDGLGRDLRAG